MQIRDGLRKRLFLIVPVALFSGLWLIAYAGSRGWLDWLLPLALWTFFLTFGLLLVASLLRPILWLIPSVRESKWFGHWPQLKGFSVSASGARTEASSRTPAPDDKPKFGGGSSGGGGASGGW